MNAAVGSARAGGGDSMAVLLMEKVPDARLMSGYGWGRRGGPGGCIRPRRRARPCEARPLKGS